MQEFSNKTWLAAHTSARASGARDTSICTPDEVALRPYTYMNNAEQILTLGVVPDVEACL